MLSVVTSSINLSVIMLNVVMLNFMAPIFAIGVPKHPVPLTPNKRCIDFQRLNFSSVAPVTWVSCLETKSNQINK